MANSDLLKADTNKGLSLDWAKFIWEALKGTAAALAAVFAMIASNQSAKNTTALDQLKAQTEQMRAQAEVRARQTDLDLKVYELVEKALSLSGAEAQGHGVAAAAMINALTDSPLRDQLLHALRVGSKDPVLVRQLQEAEEFDAEQEPAPRPANQSSRLEGTWRTNLLNRLLPAVAAQGLPGALKGYRVDLFYCEASSPAVTTSRRRRAEAALDRLRPAGESITARVRLLPSLVQARPGYQSFADEIRYDPDPAETAAAQFLSTLLKMGPSSLRVVNAKATPGYISVFYCAND